MKVEEFKKKFPDLYSVSDFVLSHYTTRYVLESILKSGYLKFCNSEDPGTENLGCFDEDIGTFYSLITPDNKLNVKVSIGSKYKVYLLFSPKLLKDYNNHYSPTWVYGEIVEGSYVYTRFPEYTENQNLQLNLNHMNLLLRENRYSDTTINNIHEINVSDNVYIPLDKYLVGILIPEEVEDIDVKKLRDKYPQYNFIDSKWKDYKKFITIDTSNFSKKYLKMIYEVENTDYDDYEESDNLSFS